MGASPVVTALEMLVGAEVGSVCFVRDYVELHFDGPILRALSDPVVEIAGIETTFPAEGSRDGLCLLIGKEIVAAREDTEALILEFGGSMLLRIPLVTSEPMLEAAHLVPTAEGRPDVANMVIWESLP